MNCGIMVNVRTQVARKDARCRKASGGYHHDPATSFRAFLSKGAEMVMGWWKWAAWVITLAIVTILALYG